MSARLLQKLPLKLLVTDDFGMVHYKKVLGKPKKNTHSFKNFVGLVLVSCRDIFSGCLLSSI